MRNQRPDNPPSTTLWTESNLKHCSLSAKGLWHELRALAAESRELGVVLIGYDPSPLQDLPRLLAPSCGETPETIERLLDHLITVKLVSVDGRGRVFCRRMVEAAGRSGPPSLRVVS